MADQALALRSGSAVAMPAELRDALGSAADYAAAEKASGTRRAYATDVALFAAWCEPLGLAAMPASVATVAGYLASLADAGLSAATINRRCAAIADHHRRHGQEPPTHAEAVRAVLRGIRRTIGTRQAAKAPATAKALQRMLKPLGVTLRDRRDRALVLVGFAAALRRSELVALLVEDLERAPDGVLVHIRRSKTDQEGAGHVVAVPRGGKLAVVDALDAWLQAARIDRGPVFRGINKADQVAAEALSDRAVADIVKRLAAAAGLDPTLFAGHSLRAGFVTSALESGADTLKVMDVTRHTSVQTLKRYDRRARAFKNHAGKAFL